MSSSTMFVCSACATKAPDSFALFAPFPVGWFNRTLNEYGDVTSQGGRPFLLCPACGTDAHFQGGISPHLRGLFAARGIAFKER